MSGEAPRPQAGEPAGAAARRSPTGSDEPGRAEELELIAGAARELARCTSSDEARSAICTTAGSVCGADSVVLFEPSERGDELVATASLGTDAEGLVLPLNENSGAALALRTNAPRFSGDRRDEPAGAADFLASIDVETVLWQPVARGRTVRAILAAGWRLRLAGLAERTVRLIEVVAVEGAVAIDRGAAFSRLVGMARSDPLTGLPNRRAWEEELRRELARAGRERTPLAVAFLDLDRFKDFNDSRGHPAGDRVLERLARLWSVEIRATDLLARHGGDEFALSLPRCDRQRAGLMLERLQNASEGWGGFCAGAVVWDFEESRDELIARVDRTLYAAKAEGPGTIRAA